MPARAPRRRPLGLYFVAAIAALILLGVAGSDLTSYLARTPLVHPEEETVRYNWLTPSPPAAASGPIEVRLRYAWTREAAQADLLGQDTFANPRFAFLVLRLTFRNRGRTPWRGLRDLWIVDRQGQSYGQGGRDNPFDLGSFVGDTFWSWARTARLSPGQAATFTAIVPVRSGGSSFRVLWAARPGVPPARFSVGSPPPPG